MNSTEEDWAVVAEYEKEPVGSDSDDCKRIRHTETRALTKNDTEKSKSSAFKPSPTLRNPQIGQQFRNVDFKHEYSLTSISSRQYIQIPANLGNLGVKLRQQATALDVVNKGIGDGYAEKENSHTTEKKIKGNNYNYFIEGYYGHYKGEQKTGEYKESDAYISVKRNLKKHLPFWEKNDKSKENSV